MMTFFFVFFVRSKATVNGVVCSFSRHRFFHWLMRFGTWQPYLPSATDSRHNNTTRLLDYLLLRGPSQYPCVVRVCLDRRGGREVASRWPGGMRWWRKERRKYVQLRPWRPRSTFRSSLGSVRLSKCCEVRTSINRTGWLKASHLSKNSLGGGAVRISTSGLGCPSDGSRDFFSLTVAPPSLPYKIAHDRCLWIEWMHTTTW